MEWMLQKINSFFTKQSPASLTEPLKAAWIFNPLPLIQYGASDLYHTSKGMQRFSAGVGKTSMRNLQTTSQLISRYEYKLGRYSASLLEPLDAMWIFNPAGLINYGALDLHNTSKKIENLFLQASFTNTNTKSEKVLPVKTKSSVKVTPNYFTASLIEPLKTAWIFNPLTLIQYSASDLYHTSKGMQRFSAGAATLSIQNLKTTSQLISRYEHKLGKYSVSLLEPLNAVWIFNPAGLIQYGISDISKKLESVQGFILNIEASITPDINF